MRLARWPRPRPVFILLRNIERTSAHLRNSARRTGKHFCQCDRINIAEHRMHSERFSISPKVARRINDARRIIAVGTTTVRTLESARGADGKVKRKEGATDLFIYPPYEFRMVDVLLTNFHLPRSTLVMLVSALPVASSCCARMRKQFAKRYRFYSYGDCILIL